MKAVVKQPFINVEEKIDPPCWSAARTHRQLRTGCNWQASALEFIKRSARWAAKGVYRFKTHEEADEWMIKMLARSGIQRLRMPAACGGGCSGALSRIKSSRSTLRRSWRVCYYRGWFPRMTTDVDLLVGSDADNEARVVSALQPCPTMPLRTATRRTAKYNVIRVADEILAI